MSDDAVDPLIRAVEESYFLTSFVGQIIQDNFDKIDGIVVTTEPVENPKGNEPAWKTYHHLWSTACRPKLKIDWIYYHVLELDPEKHRIFENGETQIREITKKDFIIANYTILAMVLLFSKQVFLDAMSVLSFFTTRIITDTTDPGVFRFGTSIFSYRTMQLIGLW